jgi:hypothetical protein
MKRLVYQEPTMTIVEVQHTQMLMTSGVGAMRSGYGEATTETWDDSEAKEYKNPVDWDE